MERFEELLERAEYMDECPAKVVLLEEAVRLGDEANRVDAGFYARLELIQAATFSGFQEKALVAFSWCLAQADRNPEQFDEANLMWQYKWILGQLPEYPQISEERIFEMNDDMEMRLERLGCSLRPAYYMRWQNLMWMGKFDAAEDLLPKWRRARRDWFADCPACETNSLVKWHIRRNCDEEAMNAAKPILDGKLSCEEIPHITLAYVLIPLIRMGRLDEAHECHRQGYPMIAKQREYIPKLGEHLIYLTRIRDFDTGVDLFENTLSMAADLSVAHRRWKFYGAAGTFLECLAAEDDSPRHFRIPKELPCFREDDTYVPSELATYFCRETDTLSAQFNARNGNDYYSREVAENRQLAMEA